MSNVAPLSPYLITACRNVSIGGQNHERALIVALPHIPGTYSKLLMVPDHTRGVVYQWGGGPSRMTVKSYLDGQLGTATPTFDEAWVLLSPHANHEIERQSIDHLFK